MDRRDAGARSLRRSRKRLPRWADLLLGVLLTPLILFEEWGWEPLRRWAARIAALPLLAAINARIARLPPYGALAALGLPAVVLLPLKLVGLWMLAHGWVAASVLLLVAAKVVGTALLAHLFSLTQPALMQLAWFARALGAWRRWKARWIARVRASAPWRAARRWRVAWRRYRKP